MPRFADVCLTSPSYIDLFPNDTTSSVRSPVRCYMRELLCRTIQWRTRPVQKVGRPGACIVHCLHLAASQSTMARPCMDEYSARGGDRASCAIDFPACCVLFVIQLIC